MTRTWILVADASRARVLEVLDRDETLQEIEDFVNPAGRQSERELRTDARGRYFGKGEQMQGHTAAPNTDPATHENQRFAKTLADYLDRARIDRRYGRLCLIAAPKFLVLLREKPGKDVAHLVCDTLDEDISWLAAGKSRSTCGRSCRPQATEAARRLRLRPGRWRLRPRTGWRPSRARCRA